MNHEITVDIRNRLIEARQKLHLTQAKLSQISKISERTIKYLESGQRTSFSKTTLLMLCRVLEIEYTELFPTNSKDHEFQNSTRKPRRKILIFSFLLLWILITVSYGIINLSDNNESARIDHVSPEKKMGVDYYNLDWNDWDGKQGIQVNTFYLKRLAAPNEIILIEMKWSYHYEPRSTPEYYVSAYTEWEPDDEIRLFNGTISGDGSRVENFVVTTPKKPGIYRIRIFFATSYGPMSSFYGHPGNNLLAAPSSKPYVETKIEIIKNESRLYSTLRSILGLHD